MNAEGTKARRHGGTKGILAVAALTLVLFSTHTLATPTPEEIAKSFNDTMEQAPDYGKLIPWFFAVCGAIAVVIYFREWQKRQAIPRALNNPGKLTKEIAKGVDIDPAELKRMKLLARELNCDSPLTLLICPSLLNQGNEDDQNRE